MESKIKVGYLISYDYKYLKTSLPTVYKDADFIALAIDKDRKTWNGGDITIPDSFFDWVKEFDKDQKIHIYEDSFYEPSLTTIECDIRERNMLAQFMGDGGWHVQVDTDEYFLDFSGFVKYLKGLNINTPVDVYAQWVTIFKQSGRDSFLIDSCEKFALATNRPVYISPRNTGRLYKRIRTKFKVLHQSWGRSEEELAFKLSNWGHQGDFNTNAYFDLWKAINKYTYKYLSNFHPLEPERWKSLEWVDAEDISELIEKVNAQQREKNKRTYSISSLFRKNK